MVRCLSFNVHVHYENFNRFLWACFQRCLNKAPQSLVKLKEIHVMLCKQELKVISFPWLDVLIWTIILPIHYSQQMFHCVKLNEDPCFAVYLSGYAVLYEHMTNISNFFLVSHLSKSYRTG